MTRTTPILAFRCHCCPGMDKHAVLGALSAAENTIWELRMELELSIGEAATHKEGSSL